MGSPPRVEVPDRLTTCEAFPSRIKHSEEKMKESQKIDKDYVRGILYGKADFEKCGGQAEPSLMGVIKELFNPSYDPRPDTPSGRQGYKVGWDTAKDASRR
jgi:hypothetical protein